MLHADLWMGAFPFCSPDRSDCSAGQRLLLEMELYGDISGALEGPGFEGEGVEVAQKEAWGWSREGCPVPSASGNASRITPGALT